MNSTIAFFLFLTFVIALLVLDAKHSKTQPFANLIPMLWLLYCASRPINSWFITNHDVANFVIAEGSLWDRNFLTALIIIGLVLLLRRQIDWHKLIAENRWLILLFLYMLVSILWSDHQYVSSKRWIKAFGSIVMALVVVTGPSPIKDFESILRRMAYILIPFSVLLVKYYPHLGIRYGRYSGESNWAGVAAGKNTLSQLCLVAAFVLIWTFVKERKQLQRSSTGYTTMAQLVILGMVFWLLKGPGNSYSATSIVVLIIGLASLVILRSMKINKYLFIQVCLFISAIGVASLSMWLFWSVTPLSIIADLTGHNATLSGRTTVIWPKLIAIALEQPVLGLGYGGYWLEPLRLGKLTINQAHNGYLDIFIELGSVGLIIFLIMLLAFVKKATDEFKYDVEWGSFRVSFLLMTVLQNYTESSYIKSTSLLWNVLVILILLGPKMTKTEELPLGFRSV